MKISPWSRPRGAGRSGYSDTTIGESCLIEDPVLFLHLPYSVFHITPVVWFLQRSHAELENPPPSIGFGTKIGHSNANRNHKGRDPCFSHTQN